MLPFFAVFMLDTCYMTVVTAAFSFFVFWSNNGRFRWYMAAGTAVGMILYARTVGRLTEALMVSFVRLLKKLLVMLIVKPMKALFRLTGKAANSAARHTVVPLCRRIGRIRAGIRTARIQNALVRDVRFPEIEEERKRERR